MFESQVSVPGAPRFVLFETWDSTHLSLLGFGEWLVLRS